MQKLRPYVLPGLFVFHLVVLCVTLSAVRDDENSVELVTALVTIVSQFFLTALFAGLGSGSWSLRIPSWGALAVLSWISLVFFLVHSDGRAPDIEFMWGVALAPPICWTVLVTLLLCLRGIPLLKWRVTLQPTLAAPQSNQPQQDSLTRGILVVVAAWGGVLMLLKDSWPWSAVATAISESSGDLLFASGIATIVGAGALVVAMLAVGLTLTRLADWTFYRRRWTLPLLVIVTMGAAVGLLLSFGGPFRSGSERLLAALWLLLGLATQPLTTLLVMGLAGYRLAPRKPLELHAREPAPETPQTTTTERAENWVSRLQRVHFAAPVVVLVFLGWIGVTGLWNDHFIRTFLGRITKNDTGEIRRLVVKPSVADAELVHLTELTNMKELRLYGTQITDAGLVHLKGLTKLQELHLNETKVTDAGLVNLKGMTRLETLRLHGDQITDAGLVHLKGLTNLQKLDLYGTKVTDAGLGHLKGMNLHTLNIPQHAKTDFGLKHFLAAVEAPAKLELAPWKITDAGLVHVKGMTNLKQLNLGSVLSKSEITDAGLVNLKGLTNLEWLWLGNQITDAGLVHLEGLTELRRLTLVDAKVTDAGLEHLKRLTKLQMLRLSRSQVTDTGIAELQKTLPNCRIIK